MESRLRLALQIFDYAPRPIIATAGALTRQVWKGGRTDLTTRTMIADPPRWLALADHTTMDGETDLAADAPLLAWDLEQVLPGDRLSPPRAGGVILVSMDVEPEREDEFNDWYNTEHIPHFRRVPGVISARRFRARRGTPGYVALYHVESVDVYATRAWMAANETPWMLRMRRFQRNRTYFMFSAPIARQ